MSLGARKALLAPAFVGACAALWSFPGLAAPVGPFGTGLPDGGLEGLSHFPRLFSWMIAAQTYFTEEMTSAIQRISRRDGLAIAILLGVAFLYGVVHAVGPGHGKAVVSSYVMTNRQKTRNAVALAFIAALAQSAGAVAFIWMATFALRLTSVAMTGLAYRLEIGSDVLIIWIGLWLAYAKIIRRYAFSNRRKPGSRPAAAGAGRFTVCEASPPTTWISTFRSRLAHAQTCQCGGLRLQSQIASGALNWRDAWTVPGVTALRPCVGALIILVFAKVEGLFGIGVLAVFSMGLGVAVTVSVIAIVSSRLAEVAAAADHQLRTGFVWMSSALEAAASLGVLAFGLLMLAANLSLR